MLLLLPYVWSDLGCERLVNPLKTCYVPQCHVETLYHSSAHDLQVYICRSCKFSYSNTQPIKNTNIKQQKNLRYTKTVRYLFISLNDKHWTCLHQILLFLRGGYNHSYVHNTYYYINTSVAPKNTQLLFFIRNYIRDMSEIFSISSLMKISLTSFLCFSFVFCLFFKFLKHSYKLKENYTLVWTYEVYLLTKKRFHSFTALTCEIFFSPEDKLHMFAQPCNIRYIYTSDLSTSAH